VAQSSKRRKGEMEIFGYSEKAPGPAGRDLPRFLTGYSWRDRVTLVLGRGKEYLPVKRNAVARGDSAGNREKGGKEIYTTGNKDRFIARRGRKGLFIIGVNWKGASR